MNFLIAKRLSDKIVRTKTNNLNKPHINLNKQGNPRHLRPPDITTDWDIRCFGTGHRENLQWKFVKEIDKKLKKFILSVIGLKDTVREKNSINH